ncbi:antizyme inhibitor 2 isoform X6 [Aotus nancymaae]|uniref:antizyme inhibitor 2 isoform X6 n=1 Tax=Aotus nancymaae TaxID=37293 RepID=UPI0030FE348B
MAGYLSESDFVMVEEGFSTQDLLEELTLGASQATTDKATAFFVADLGAIVRKHFCFLKCLPRVRPFYAVKCNSSPGVLKVLAQLGLGFSCANKAEMELVQHIGIPASKIIYANPCKQIAQIKYAAKHGIQLLSFDNEMELAKVVKSHPSANLKALTDVETDLEELELPQERMVLCIANDDSHSLSRLSLKFGVPLKSCRHLLESAKKSHVEVVGVSFHVGSGCPDPQAYAQSIADARLVFEMGTELGHRMHVLDLGGGFPGTEGAKVRFEEIASVINSALDLYFPEGCGVDILAELGRYYVTSAFTVAVSIIAKKEVLLDQPGREEENGSAPKTIVYHLDEGVYGIFNSVLFDNICPTPILQKLMIWLPASLRKMKPEENPSSAHQCPTGFGAHLLYFLWVPGDELSGLPACSRSQSRLGGSKAVTPTTPSPASVILSPLLDLSNHFTDMLYFFYHRKQHCHTLSPLLE